MSVMQGGLPGLEADQDGWLHRLQQLPRMLSTSCNVQDGQSEEDARKCPSCGGRLGLKLAKTGGFIGCSNYPGCTYARPLDIPAQGLDVPGWLLRD